jgi:hypothetical protein
LSLLDIDCAECAEKVVAELKKIGPVYGSTFDRKRVVFHVVVDPKNSDPRRRARRDFVHPV